MEGFIALRFQGGDDRAQIKTTQARGKVRPVDAVDKVVLKVFAILPVELPFRHHRAKGLLIDHVEQQATRYRVIGRVPLDVAPHGEHHGPRKLLLGNPIEYGTHHFMVQLLDETDLLQPPTGQGEAGAHTLAIQGNAVSIGQHEMEAGLFNGRCRWFPKRTDLTVLSPVDDVTAGHRVVPLPHQQHLHQILDALHIHPIDAPGRPGQFRHHFIGHHPNRCLNPVVQRSVRLQVSVRPKGVFDGPRNAPQFKGHAAPVPFRYDPLFVCLRHPSPTF